MQSSVHSTTRDPVRGDTSVDLSVIIVTWNCKAFVLDCLNSLQEDLEGRPAEVIVVDNGSSDGTPEVVAERFPDVRLIRTGSNLGFAKANNLGMQLAIGRYICLLNPDVKILRGCIRGLCEYLDEHPKVGLLGPAMLEGRGAVVRSYMRFPTLWNCLCRALALDRVFRNFALFGGQLMTDFVPDKITEVDVLNGWFWVVRPQALAQVGPLDERFFMYAEDIDWCRRFRQAGWKVVYFPFARAVHYGGGCSSNATVRFFVEMQRATVTYWEKHHCRAAQIGFIAIACINHLVRGLGYGLLSIVALSKSTEAKIKAKSSFACIRWLVARSMMLETNRK